MENNLKVFFLYITRSLSTGFSLRLYSKLLICKETVRHLQKVGEILISKIWIEKFAVLCDINLGWFFYIINNFVTNCDNFCKNIDDFNFFKSILMQSNSISAKIAILSLIWRSQHQRWWCYWIYWPYVKDIRLTFRSVASL